MLHVRKYLVGTLSLCLTLKSNRSAPGLLQVFTDSTWADDPHSQKSQTGFIIFWKSSPFAWKSRKQSNITLSSMEAELNALTDGAQESLWIQSIVGDLWRDSRIQPSDFYVDNKGLVNKVKHFGSNSKTKYIDMKMKWLREQSDSGDIHVNLIGTDKMIANSLTKAANKQALNLLATRCFYPTSH